MKLPYQDQIQINRLFSEIADDEFFARSMLAKSPTVANAIQGRIAQKRAEIADIFEIGGDYR
jgi:hypothetical protein